MVPNNNSHLKNTTGGSFTAQRQGGTLIGLSAATSIITKAILVKDVNSLDTSIYPGPKEITGTSVYNTQKILSGGAFAYNAAKNKTWVLSRISTTLAGVAQTFLQSMGNVIPSNSFPYYVARNWINNTTLVRKGQFSFTGWDSNGDKIKKRTTWITNPTGTSGADFGTSTQLPTRAVPGELFILTNFVDYNPSTSSNYYNYPVITGK